METLKANDLRIGNYIEVSFLQDNGKFKYEMIQVIANTIKDAERYGNEWDARPIPLTEEWLLKAGFIKQTKLFREKGYYKDGWYLIIAGNGIYKYELMVAGSSVVLSKIKYLHQLQNLWKELTGNELMFKEK